MDRVVELDAPNVSDIEKEYIYKCIDAGFVSTFGPFVPEFEKRFAAYLGARNAVSTQSGTAALHMALYELGIGPGDEVIVPVLTFVATVNPIKYVGATPVFVDVDIHTWNIDPAKIEENITEKTKAIIPVHFYGNPCDMDEVMQIAKSNNLFVVEDATESLGAKFKGIHTGTFGDLGCFSFNGNKIITTGGGGMVVGSDEKHPAHIKFLVNQARDELQGYYYPEIGFNYRMTNLEAAVGLAQFKHLEGFLVKKRTFNRIYREELKSCKEIVFQEEYPQAQSSCWLSCVVFERDIDISSLQKELKEEGIPTRRIFMPLVEFPPYKNYKRSDYKDSYYIYERGLCLPTTLNSEDDTLYICKCVKEIIRSI